MKRITSDFVLTTVIQGSSSTRQIGVDDTVGIGSRLESVTDPAFLSRSDNGSVGEDNELDLEYDHDYMRDPLNVTVVESEDAVIDPLIDATIAIKKPDGNKEYCIVIDKQPGNNEDNCLYVLKERDSDRQVTVDLTTLDWSPVQKVKKRKC